MVDAKSTGVGARTDTGSPAGIQPVRARGRNWPMIHLYHDEVPPDDEPCPFCGSPLNWQGICPDWRAHDDPYDMGRD